MTKKELDSLNVGDIVMYDPVKLHGFVRAISSARSVIFVQYFHDAISCSTITWSNVKNWDIVSK